MPNRFFAPSAIPAIAQPILPLQDRFEITFVNAIRDQKRRLIQAAISIHQELAQNGADANDLNTFRAHIMAYNQDCRGLDAQGKLRSAVLNTLDIGALDLSQMSFISVTQRDAFNKIHEDVKFQEHLARTQFFMAHNVKVNQQDWRLQCSNILFYITAGIMIASPEYRKTAGCAFLMNLVLLASLTFIYDTHVVRARSEEIYPTGDYYTPDELDDELDYMPVAPALD